MVRAGRRRAVDRQTSRQRIRIRRLVNGRMDRRSDSDEERIWLDSDRDVLGVANRNAVQSQSERRIQRRLERFHSLRRDVGMGQMASRREALLGLPSLRHRHRCLVHVDSAVVRVGSWAEIPAAKPLGVQHDQDSSSPPRSSRHEVAPKPELAAIDEDARDIDRRRPCRVTSQSGDSPDWSTHRRPQVTSDQSDRRHISTRTAMNFDVLSEVGVVVEYRRSVWQGGVSSPLLARFDGHGERSLASPATATSTSEAPRPEPSDTRVAAATTP